MLLVGGVVLVLIIVIVLAASGKFSKKSVSPPVVSRKIPARPFPITAPATVAASKPAAASAPAPAPAPVAPAVPAPAALPAPAPAPAPAPVTAPVASAPAASSAGEDKPEPVLQPLGIKTALQAARTLPRARALASAKPAIVQPRISAVENGAQGVSRPTERRMGTSGKVMSLFSRQPDELDKRDVDVATRGFPSMEEGDHETSSSHDNMMRKYSFENFREAMMRGSPKSILGGDEEDEVSSSERIWRSTGHTRAAYERHVQPLARQMRASGSRADESSSTNEALAAALL